MRKGEQIGASLEAKLAIHADQAIVSRYAPVASELRFFFITSELRLDLAGGQPADAVLTELEGADVWVSATVSGALKCVRCWHRRDDVGTHAAHPELCDRCISNVEGPGEDRRWF